MREVEGGNEGGKRLAKKGRLVDLMCVFLVEGHTIECMRVCSNYRSRSGTL